MLCVLQTTPYPPKGRRRLTGRFRRGEATACPVTVPGGHFLLIKAAYDRRGRLDWERIALLAGRGVSRLLVPGGVIPPAGMGGAAFSGGALAGELMAKAAVRLLKTVPGLERRPVVVVDPAARHAALVERLLPLAGRLRVITGDPAAYRAVAARAMVRLGACLPVGGDWGALAGAALAVAPDGVPDRAPQPRGWLLTRGESGRRPRTVSGYLPPDAGEWLAFSPPGIDPWAFLAGLYECSGVAAVAARPPQTVCAGGRTMALGEIAFALAGLDIGISV